MSIELPVVKAGLEIGIIDPQNEKITVHDNAVGITFGCSMTADCCSNLKIPVTDFDIKRIEDHGYELDQIIKQASPVIRFSNRLDGTGEKNYWIKRKPFDNTCTFLEGNKCSIHEFKPFACRIFPFQLRDLEDDRIMVVVHASNLCQSVSTVATKNSENKRLLNEILEEVIKENKYRETYFSKFSK